MLQTKRLTNLFILEAISGKYEEDFEVYQSFLETKLEEEDSENESEVQFCHSFS